MIAFESRKRAANPHKTSALNVSLPFSFIDFHKKHLVSATLRDGQVLTGSVGAQLMAAEWLNPFTADPVKALHFAILV